VVTFRVGWSPQPVDYKYANTRYCEHCFPTPLLDQLRGNDGERRKVSVLGVGLNRTERNQRLTCTALRNHCALRNILAAPSTIKWPHGEPKCLVLNLGGFYTGVNLKP
jgi:hypothetical protein